jgi:SAM-dependent methyltransferase
MKSSLPSPYLLIRNCLLHAGARWRLKACALAVLSRVPAGRHAYLALQTFAGTTRLKADEGLRCAIELAAMVREAGRDPGGLVVLEVGTGWHPFVPALLHLIGADRVITIDKNPWLTWSSASQTFAALADRLDTIGKGLAIDVADVQRRYEEAARRQSHDLPSLLSALNTDYRYPVSAERTGLPDASIDVVCSSNVLEHLPLETLRGLHAESRRILKPGGLAVHRLNPGDHYSGSDKSISSVNFLQYSERRWRLYGSGLAYHNRLRCSQHRQILEDAGFLIRVDRRRVDDDALALLRREHIALDRAFANFSLEDLAADYMWMVGVK